MFTLISSVSTIAFVTGTANVNLVFGAGNTTSTPSTQPACPAGTHYSMKQGGCVSNGQPLDDGTCATDWHPHGSICYYNNVPGSNGTCQPGWHLVTNPDGGRICERDKAIKTPSSQTNNNNTGGASKTTSNLPIVVQRLPGGGCPSGYHLVSGVVCIKDNSPSTKTLSTPIFSSG